MEFNVPFQHKYGYIRDDAHRWSTCPVRQFSRPQLSHVAMNMVRNTRESCRPARGICRCQRTRHFLWSWDHPSCWPTPASKCTSTMTEKKRRECRTRIIQQHPFNGPLSGTTRVSRYQKGKTNVNLTDARAAAALAGPYASLHLTPDRYLRRYPSTQFFTGRIPFQLPPNQRRQGTEDRTE